MRKQTLTAQLRDMTQSREAWRSDAKKWESQALQLLGDLDSLKSDFYVKTQMLIAAQKALNEMQHKFIAADTAREQASNLSTAERRRADEMDMQNKELRVTLAYYVALAQRIVRP